jgi:hypothetical protein
MADSQTTPGENSTLGGESSLEQVARRRVGRVSECCSQMFSLFT